MKSEKKKLFNEGMKALENGALETAKRKFKNLVKLAPDFFLSYFQLGITFFKLNNFVDAEINFRTALKFKPDYADGQNNLGLTLFHLQKFYEAEEHFKKAIKINPNFFDAYNNLGSVMDQLNRQEAAIKCFKKVVQLRQYSFLGHFNLGVAYKKRNKLVEAKRCFIKVIQLNPNFLEAYTNLGIIFQDLGNFKLASQQYKKAIAINPLYVKAHYNLSLMKKFNKIDAQFEQMKTLYHNKNLNDEDKGKIGFSLGKACENLNFFSQSFSYYLEANALIKKSLNYCIQRDVYHFKKIKTSFRFLEEVSIKSTPPTEAFRPIFILGMPRSGTTLVEQIISAHSQVSGLGELPFVGRFGKLFADGKLNCSAENLKSFRSTYLNEISTLRSQNLFFTDKMPLNFQYIGLICSAFPEAKIVHVKRSSVATCWSNFKQYFANKQIGFCYDLKDLIDFYDLYIDLINFWKKKFSDRIYELSYEKLVENQELETKKLIHNLDLKWETNCLHPEKNNRSVSTASATQIRRNIYKGSSEQWEKFRRYLPKFFYE